MGETLKPITAKDHDLPKLRKQKKLVNLRPCFSIKEDDHRALLRVASLMGVSMSGWIKMQVLRSLGND